MFESDLNIVFGDTKTGRTKFLIDFSRKLNELGFKVFFLGCTNEFQNSSKSILESFSGFRIIDSYDDDNNYKLIDVINEILSRDSYDYLFVDDIDFVSNRCKNEIIKINIKKIITCLSYNKDKFKSNSFHKVEDMNDFLISDFITSLTRDKKINSILDDKS